MNYNGLTNYRPAGSRFGEQILAAASLAIGVLFGLRLIDLQLFQGEKYRQLADENRFFTQKIPAQRGSLLDRYGQPLVLNQKKYFWQPDSTRLFAQKQPIGRDQALNLMATASAQVVFDFERSYLYPSLANVIGYLSPVTATDLAAEPNLSLTAKVGRLGLEKSWELAVRGQAGRQQYEVNHLGQKQRLVTTTSAQSGQDLATSLDPILTEVSAAAMGDFNGAVVILDAQTGQILSLVSRPTFDPNLLIGSSLDPQQEAQRQQVLQAYFANDSQVFFNKAVSGAYPAGSIFKLVTALAGLESGVLTSETKVLDEGVLKVGDYEYANWYYTQYGRTEGEISLVRAIARSNDIFFYQAAGLIGPDLLAAKAREFGFGQTTGVELAGETAGLVPDPAWKEKTLGEKWYLGNTYHFGIGQGDVLVSPLQIAQLGQAIVNNGELCQPRLAQQNNRGGCRNLGLAEDDSQLVLSGMLQACSSGGTGFPLFKYNQGYDQTTKPEIALANGNVACKTGTAEFGAADQRGYRRTHGWFLALFDSQLNQENSSSSANLRDPALTVSEPTDRPATASATAELNRDLSAKSDQQSAMPWLSAADQIQLRTAISQSANFLTDPEINIIRARWLTQAQANFPRRLVIAVLVESDDQQLYQEGSAAAGPVVAKIMAWIRGK